MAQLESNIIFFVSVLRANGRWSHLSKRQRWVEKHLHHLLSSSSSLLWLQNWSKLQDRWVFGSWPVCSGNVSSAKGYEPWPGKHQRGGMVRVVGLLAEEGLSRSIGEPMCSLFHLASIIALAVAMVDSQRQLVCLMNCPNDQVLMTYTWEMWFDPCSLEESSLNWCLLVCT